MEDRATVAVLPPVILSVAILSGVALEWVHPTGLLPASTSMPLGIVAIVFATGLVVWAARELSRARTAFDVRRATTAIVVTGPYRLTRNPVYLSMLLLYLGIGALLNSAWMVALTWPVGSILCFTAIRPEERYLQRKFPDAYTRYKTTVRRWL
jgi:protein-S-isoprenylcysteine O-methyltransferase Ste14